MPAFSDTTAFPTIPTGGNPLDPSAINQALTQNYQALGVSPTGVGSGPTDISYYQNAIANTGGLSQSNWNYWFGPNGRIATDVGGAGTGGAGGPGGTGGLGGGANPTYPFSQPFTGNPTMAPYQTPPAFTPPTAADVSQTPGFQFNMQQGLGAISNSQAAQGLWGSGATGKAMQNYAENLANTYYQNYYNNALQTYGTNLSSQYTQPYAFNWQTQNQNFQNQLSLWQDWFNQKYQTGMGLAQYQQY